MAVELCYAHSQVFGSTKNFYCCRSRKSTVNASPLEVLRISTVVDAVILSHHILLWKY